MIKLRGIFAFLLVAVVTTATPVLAQDTGRPSQDYVTKAAMGDMFEIQSSRIALKKSHDTKVKSFASRMVKVHTAGSAKMKNIIKSGELPLVMPVKLDDAHQQMLDQLNQASAGAFDKTYLDMQKKGHNEALALHQGYAEHGNEPALKVFAKKTATVVQMHIEMLQGMH
jgi:putative membrane protein